MLNAHEQTKSTPTGAVHPLDPLTIEEIRQACNIVRADTADAAALRFPWVELLEPVKSEVEAFTGGSDFPRRALLVTLDTSTGAATEAVVDLRRGVLESRKSIKTDHEHGQPPILVEDFHRAAEIVKANADWRAALKRRGLTDAEIDLVQVDPISPGYFDFEPYKGRRILRAVTYYRAYEKDNAYAHPVEGLVAVVDLIEGAIISLEDDGRNVPIPRKQYNYETAALGAPRTDLKPLEIVQPEGPSFTVDGWKVTWQDWEFRVGFTPREGVVLSQLGFRNEGRVRPIIYRASITEMAVPYADPTPQHFAKCAFDAGEFGLGKLANQLELGCDCLGHIHYFDVPASDDFGQPFVMKNAICMHEEDYGILWKHNEFRSNVSETRRSRRLVISFFATVGNYDYGFYWYLYQDGTVQLEAKLTGIVQTAALEAGERYKYGGMITPDLGGPSHQHFFNARLHMAIDGTGNSVTQHDYRSVPLGEKNPYGNVFEVASELLENEADAARNAAGATGRYWKVINPNITNEVGNHPGYKVVVMPSPTLLADPASSVAKRAGFAQKHIWVTPYAPEERFASGDYPNQHGGECGLPVYVRQKRSIVNQDIVLWHSFGHTHVCKPEDFPIMPVEYAGFTLKPNNFFMTSPAMTIPPATKGHHSRSGGGEACCHGPTGTKE
ncbi:primary-amine oxidase [Devosia sp. 63-57]|uniref:primary-amine oxidase n=1 Tax=Devosia sp. 63-57 TaxID=1895751 RepID=UPI00086CB56C|nr:primary-amine oxidase [Devosia sp. 63-57]ODT47138.1 MAG: tyramine oxidase [Pelagibacterium sp. SCN 63-126]ODU88952.1 MAG: tyramine oxidase [Pelagibacterium sp. SCN 63-17]OJX43151.1 MAG: tyramine oxidase [Devosia sp. 63-57]